MNLDYGENIEFLKNNLKIRDIYDFRGTGFEDEYQKMFEFYQQAIEGHYNYGINPSYFYFYKDKDKDDEPLNARAKKLISKEYLIFISKGLVEHFDRKYNYFDLNNFENLKEYVELEKKIDYRIGELMKEISYHFTLYHELGHLIQFVDNFDIEVEESINTDRKDFLIEDHVSELDADIHGAICVSTHIYEFVEKNIKKGLNTKEISNLVSILSCSIFLYFFSFKEYKEGFYLKKTSHPHPLIRLLCVIPLIQYFDTQITKNKTLNIKINQDEILHETFRVLAEILPNMGIDTDFTSFMNDLKANWKDIKSYHTELKDILQSDSNSAINKRNRMILKNF